MDGGTGDEVGLRQLAQALTTLTVPEDGGPVQSQRFAPDVPAFELGASHAGAHPLDDQVALEFSDCPDNDDDRPAQWPSRIDLLSEADELDVEAVQLIQHVEEVFDGPGDAIGGSDQDDIELATPAVPHHGVETWPSGLRSADHVRVLFDDPIAALFGHLAEVVELGFRVLVECGDPQI